MSPVKWCICATIISVFSQMATAQSVPFGSVGSNGNDLPVLSRQQVPLPPAGQPEQVPRPTQEPAVPVGMTLAELEEMALRCNPTVAQAANRVAAVRGHWVQVGLYPNPRRVCRL